MNFALFTFFLSFYFLKLFPGINTIIINLVTKDTNNLNQSKGTLSSLLLKIMDSAPTNTIGFEIIC